MQLNVNDYASMTGKNRLPCIQTMCYWSAELEKRGNITKNIIVFVASGNGQNCHRLWWAFNCQFKSSSVPMGL